MKNSTSGLNQKSAAIMAAIALFANIILAGSVHSVILPKIVGIGDATNILENIVANEQQFRIAIFLLTLNVIADIVVFWALYFILKPVNKSISILAALFGAMHTVVALSAINNLSDLLHLTCYPLFNTDMEAAIALHAFHWAWQAGMVMFGIHLILRGWLLYRAAYMDKMLGIVMFIVAAGYLIDGFGQILISGYNSSVVSVYVGWMEALLPIWLIIKVRKAETLSPKVKK